jgi:hypothetical protein
MDLGIDAEITLGLALNGLLEGKDGRIVIRWADMGRKFIRNEG